MTTSPTASERTRTSEEHLDAQAKKAKTPLPNFSRPTELVTFLVGKEEPFSIHKEFACHHSPVLKAAFNSSFIEGQTQTYRLEDMLPSAFRLLAKWFYSERGEVYIEDDTDEIHQDTVDEKARARDLNLAQLWVAGDQLLIPGLQNAVMWAWHEIWNDTYFTLALHRLNLKEVSGAFNCRSSPECTSSWVAYAYEHTSPQSPLRHLAVDQFIYVIKADALIDHPDDFPREMLLDLAITCNLAIFPRDTEETQNKGDEQGPIMQSKRSKYRCVRTWRSYLVPEDVQT